MPTIHGYTCVSSDDQVKSGLGLAAGVETVNRYIDYRLSLDSMQDVRKGEVFAEEGISASAVPLLMRPEGLKLLALLKHGDHVVFYKHDRSFRSIKDLVITKTRFDSMGVTMHFANLSIDLSTPEGERILHAMVSVAQWESRIISERTKAALAQKQQRGEKTGGFPGAGMKVVGTKRNKSLLPDPDQQPIMRLIVALRNCRGMSWDKISDRVEELLAKREGRKAIPRVWCGRHQRKWTGRVVRGAYDTQLKIMKASGITR